MLLPHNEKVYRDIKNAYKRTNNLLLVHGTGLGKSFLFLELCQSVFRGKKILFIVPKHATKTGGIESYDEYKDTGADVTFKTYNYFKDADRTIEAVLAYDIIVFDEAHHLGSDLYGKNALKTFPLMDMHGKYILGLTATNVRNDKLDVKQYFSETIIGCSILEAIGQGIVPSFEYLVCKDDAERALGYDGKVSDYRKKIDYYESLPLLKDIVKNNPRKRWMVFFPNTTSLAQHQEIVKNAFGEDYTYLTITAYNKTKTSEIEEYDRTVVLCVDKLLEGVHVSGTTGIILFRNIRSLPVFQQVLGRVVHVGSTEHPLIIDCTQSAVRMLAKLLQKDTHNGGGSGGVGVKKPILYCSLENVEYFNLAKLLALSEDLPWSEEEIEILKKNYNKLKIKELLNLLPNRNYGAIQTKALKLGLTISREHTWTEEELKILKENIDKCNIKELLKLLPKKTEIAIKSKAKTLGLQMVKTVTSWTEAEDDIIRENADKMRWTDMEKLLPNRNAQTIRARANKLGITHYKKWSDTQIQWLKSVYETMDINDIAKHLGKSKESVLVFARSIGLYKGRKRIKA